MTMVRTLARLARHLEHASCGLSLPQYRLLAMVADGDERATDLAGRLALAKPTVTAAVDGLVERGLLTRTDVPGDRRAACIRVTAAGRRALHASEAAMDEHLASMVERCPHPDAVRHALAELEAALDAAHPPFSRHTAPDSGAPCRENAEARRR
jgi:DNA-binding MarR family transcriptional regulator